MPGVRRRRDPVVTGIGAITPLGHSAPETWDGLINGRSGIGPIESFDASDLPVRIAECGEPATVPGAQNPPAPSIIIERVTAGIEIELIGGRRVRFERDVDPQTMKQVVLALEAEADRP